MTGAGKRLRPPAQGAADAAEDVSAAGNRLILRSERALRGIMSVQALFEGPEPLEEKTARLAALIDQTRFQNEKVLKEYAGMIEEIFKNADRPALDKLVLDFQSRLERAAKDGIIRENLAAAASVIPEDLLRDVVTAMKNEGPPQVTIERQRVLDLLRSS